MIPFPALPGFYRLLFLHLEPSEKNTQDNSEFSSSSDFLLVSTISPAFISWFFPGAAWFHHQLIPTSTPVPSEPLDPRTKMAMWQLGNCTKHIFSSYQQNKSHSSQGYLLLGLISSLVFRAVRDALPNDPAAQERIVGASLMALAIADVRANYSISRSQIADISFPSGLAVRYSLTSLLNTI